MLKRILANQRLQSLSNNGHWQTIWPRYLTNRLLNLDYQRQRIYTPDGDFIDLDWVNPGVIDKPTVILFHGMEGNSQSHYARRIMYHLQTIGWRGCVAHARGCSGELNATLSSYHAGLTSDIQLVVETVKKITPSQLFIVGISLGGNAMLKFLGENNPTSKMVNAACAISVPFDLELTSKHMNNGLSKRLYTPYFMKSLLPKMKSYAEKFPQNFSLHPEVKTMHEFNELYITQMYSFKNAMEYYAQSSSINFLKNITIPTLLIQAINDPMIPISSLPKQKQLSPTIRFVKLNSGGHAGFVSNNRNLKKALLKLPQIMVQYYRNYSNLRGNIMSLKSVAQQTLGLIDLTTLNDNDTNEIVVELCKKASTEFGSVPAICIFRQFIPAAKEYFQQNKLNIKIATVTNFPHGGTDLELALKETQEAINLGADEVDIVFPYKALMNGDTAIGAEMIKKAKQICGNKTLKVIIESGVLNDPKLIEQASDISIANGADFIKTSTGKVAVNATLEATEIMLNSIKKNNKPCGFKAAGGIRSVAEAKEYLELTARIMGKDWINANNFRFGASSILTDLLNILNDRESVINNNLY